ncbi:hypothetical protein [Pseudonocardia sp. T1-2H]|uniref:hypothetical protein n=1 Tax=Pseudonocardia sp. T1-2H TaxID=3128899 RepID=UPI003101A176
MTALETRWYIAVIGGLRFAAKVGPDPVERFHLGPLDPMPLDDGVLAYPVSQEIHDEWTADAEDDERSGAVPDTGRAKEMPTGQAFLDAFYTPSLLGADTPEETR